MTPLEMVHLYEQLVRENGNSTYSIHRRSKYMQLHKDSFKKLKQILDEKDIPIEDFMRVQFMNKGTRPFPNQMNGTVAMTRWKEHKASEDISEIYNQQERYLASYISQDYTIEEALNFDVFYYWFRCLKMKDYPAIWKFYAKKELEKMPDLKKIIGRKYV